jgi:hypothetical protein
VLKNTPLYWPVGDGTAVETYMLDDRQRIVDATEYKLIEKQMVGMKYEGYKWVRIAVEELCAELNSAKEREVCVKEEMKQVLARVERTAKRLGRK